MKPGYQLRKHSRYRRMRWRNGRGFTLEIARQPAVGEEFAWRLSLADIDSDGDFSPYPGYRRAIVLVAGERVNLKFKGHGKRTLDPKRRGARFEGDWETQCAIPAGRCTDLSLIVRRGSGTRPGSVVRAPRMMRVEATAGVLVGSGLHGALFVIAGSVSVGATNRARTRIMRARDTLLLSPGEQRTLRLRSLESSAAQLILLSWRPGRPKMTVPGR